MEEIAPGNILQRMYFKSRLKDVRGKRFCEIGPGNGHLSKLMLDAGMTGVGYDLNASACANNEQLNAGYIKSGAYKVVNDNVLTSGITDKFDIILSCMVIEHLNPEDVDAYFNFCKRHLNENGRIVVLVPAGMKFWGIEDEIAGHFKRYAFDDFKTIAQNQKLKIADLAGLTYPLSNWLLGLSNFLVKKNEGYKKELTLQEQTVLSGNRNVPFKTTFPAVFKLVLNEVVLYPFYLLQLWGKNNANSMVIYCEMQKQA